MICLVWVIYMVTLSDHLRCILSFAMVHHGSATLDDPGYSIPDVCEMEYNKVDNKEDVKNRICAANAKGNDLCWSTCLGPTVFACLDQPRTLKCPARGYSVIEWTFFKNVNEIPEVVTSDDHDDSDNREHFLIKNMLEENAGYFKCTAKGKGEEISHVYKVYAVDCRTPSAGPVIGEPTVQHQVLYRSPGDYALLSCSAAFPRTSIFQGNILDWYIRIDGVLRKIKSLNDSDIIKYPPEVKKTENLATKRLTLNVTNIQNDDYRKYNCVATSFTKSDYSVVELRPGAGPPVSPPWWIFITVGCSVFFIISITWLAWWRRLDILLWHHSRFGKQTNQNGNYEYHAMLIHSGKPSDYRFVRHTLYAHLHDQCKYVLFLPERDLDIGCIDDAYIEGMRKCHRLILLITENFLKSSVCGNLYNYILAEGRHKDVIFIMYGGIPDQLWHESDQIPNIVVLRTAVQTARMSWLGLGCKIVWNEKCTSAFWKKLFLALPPQTSAMKYQSNELG